MPQHVDIAGQPIQVGALICYAALWSRSATLRYGRVTELQTRKAKSYGTLEDQEDKPTLRVFAIDRVHKLVKVEGGWTSKERWEILNNGKPITLGFLDRLLVVPEILIPPQALKLLRRT